MSTLSDGTRGATWLRLLLGVAVVPVALGLALAAAGSGNFPLGAVLLVAPLYVLGVVTLDLRSLIRRQYRARPWYLVGWLTATTPPLAWLIWLGGIA